MDDMVDTAGTLCKAAGALKDHGAKKVLAYCVHPVLSGAAVSRINESALDELVVTDTIPLNEEAQKCSRIRQLSVADVLARVGINLQLQNVEWAQWLSGTYGSKNYDLTLISHVEPFDLGNYAKPDYYWGYQSVPFNALYEQIKNAARATDRARLLAEAQRLLAEDAVHAFLYQPQWVTVANKNLRGLWKDMPVFVNDLSALSWA